MCASRPTTAPDFLLSRATGSVRTQGSVASYTDVDKAIDDIEAQRVEMVVGALPFDLDKPAALTVPKTIVREPGSLEPPAYFRQQNLTSEISGVDPDTHEHLRRVEAAVATINASRLEKVVLARAVDIEFNGPVDPMLVAARLIDLSNHRDGFAADLTPAGYDGAMLVGASPEVLVKKKGNVVSAFPLAGSAARSANPEEDRAAGEQLLNSNKDLREHAFVVEHLAEILAPMCDSFYAPNTPQLVQTNEMWHLGTPITGTLKKPTTTALELAVRCHPTPAICGTPTAAAKSLICTAETDRGFYSGAVGWCDVSGDGEYMVAIRCAEVAGDGLTARAWAGGGIVEDSDPEAELAETTAKLQTIVRAMGIQNF
ncbi:isochorismate synthase [Corynebacterium casei]|uniref:isochorismate synthase n=1 Tax=Corynebacterium casei TaxID=160386 RepID=UPI003FD209C9